MPTQSATERGNVKLRNQRHNRDYWHYDNNPYDMNFKESDDSDLRQYCYENIHPYDPDAGIDECEVIRNAYKLRIVNKK